MLQGNAGRHRLRGPVAGAGVWSHTQAPRQTATPRAARARTFSWHQIYSVTLFLILASIDNTVFALLPTMTPLMAANLGVNEAALGMVIGLSSLTVACTAVYWEYRSDQGDRRTLLIMGTLPSQSSLPSVARWPCLRCSPRHHAKAMPIRNWHNCANAVRTTNPAFTVVTLRNYGDGAAIGG